MYSLTVSPHFAAAVAIFFFSLSVSFTTTRGGSFFLPMASAPFRNLDNKKAPEVGRCADILIIF